MNDMNLGARRQQGAALVIGLILLVVLTILAVSGVFTSTMELRMVRNMQSQERAFQAAEFAIEDALANPVAFDQRRCSARPTIAVPNSPGDEYSYDLQFVGQTPLGTGMTGLQHRQRLPELSLPGRRDRRTGPDNAVSNHTQSFYVVGPGT